MSQTKKKAASRGQRNPTSVWIAKRKGKRGTSYRIRWIDPQTGMPRSEACGRDLAYARDQRNAKRIELREGLSGRLPEKSVSDLREALDEFMAGRSPNTVRKSRASLKSLADLCGDRRLVHLDRGFIMRFRSARLGNGAKPATVNKDLRQIKSALSYAVHAGWLRLNPMRNWKGLFLPEPKKKIRVIEPSEFEVLSAKVEYLPLKALLFVAYYQGLRRAELVNLRWDAIRLDKSQLVVENVVEANELTKNLKVRAVPLHEKCRAVLAEHWGSVAKIIRDRQHQPKYPHAFTWEDGAQFKVDWLTRWFTKLVTDAGLKHATLHDLRRSFSTIAQRAGVDKATVKDLGGWSTIRVVEQHYTGEVPEALERAMRKIESSQEKAG